MTQKPFSSSGIKKQKFNTSYQLNTLEVTDLVEETPLAISINGVSHAVMMVTPIHLDDFALGFALSEGLIENIYDVRDLDLQTVQSKSSISALSINIEVSPRRFSLFKQTKKARLGATGCGLCGTESLDEAFPELIKLPTHDRMSENVLTNLKESLSEHQVIGKKSGAIHAALLLSVEGEAIICREDIGRHNALDKVIGYALQHNIPLHNHSVLMSSRCSSELVQKAVKAKISSLVHLASPSSLATELAQYYGLTLIHLPKKDAPRIFSPLRPERDISNE